MPFYIQYDENGNIGATVLAEDAPICERQIAFDQYMNTDGKRVDVVNKVLIDAAM